MTRIYYRHSEPAGRFPVLIGMTNNNLHQKFEKIGVRLKVVSPSNSRRRSFGDISIDVGSDRHGEHFQLFADPESLERVQILDARPRDRHLLMRSMAGKPHWAQFCYRTGGETVYVCSRYPAGLLQNAYDKLIRNTPHATLWAWRVMRRNMDVFVRGTIRHSDHATLHLSVWHRVAMNTENQSSAMAFVTFLD
jgi:hypothetical protein